MKKEIFFILLIMLFISGCNSKSEMEKEVSNEISTENELEERKDPNEMYYELANEAISEKKYVSALSYLYACNNYLDAEDKINELTAIIDENRIGKSCFVLGLESRQMLAYIDQDLKLQLMGTGKDKYDINIDEWMDLKLIDVTYDFIVGVKNDGTVLMANLLGEVPKVDISDWTDIKDIEVADSADDPLIVGLKNDGTVIYTRSKEHDSYMKEHSWMEEIYPERTETWSNIKKICNQSPYGVFGLTEEGKIVCTIESRLTKMEDVHILDVGNFCVAIGSKGIQFAGGASTYVPSLDGVIDAVVSHDFIAFLFDNGKIVIGNIKGSEVDISKCELDNILAISLAHEGLLAAYGSDGSINLIGNIDLIPKDIDLTDTPINIFSLEFIKKEKTEETIIEKVKKEPEIGMTQDEVLESTWGTPRKKNITETTYGTFEQWVYSDYRYLYFDNGILTSIQRSE